MAWRGLTVSSTLVLVILLAVSGRYGYHRDELYFLVIGSHPEWGYADQPPLIPLLAHGMDAAFGGSLVMLRVPPALAAAGIVLVTGLIARELGGRKPSQLIAALCMAVSAVVLAAGHLAGTTAFDLFGWTLVSWLAIRAIRDDGPAWLLVGLAAAVTLEIKSLIAFLLVGLTVGLLAVGPRTVFRSRWPYLAAAIALLIWLPNLIWQATNGWPQLELSKAIANGSSGTSDSPLSFLLLQLGLVSPVLVPVWAIGWWRLLRGPELARWRCFAIAYVVLLVLFLVTGGKAYYMAGLYPTLIGAGATVVYEWAARHGRRPLLRGALLFSFVAAAYLFLPIVPPSQIDPSPITAVNYDAGEQIGWPELARTVETAYDGLDATERRHTIVLTANYGEAGALEKYARSLPVYSGHNSMWDLGPPPDDAEHAVVLGGWETDELSQWFDACRQVATISNDAGVDNDEDGTPVRVCDGPTTSWSRLWPELRTLG